MLSGAGLFKGAGTKDLVHVHTTANAFADSAGIIDLTDGLAKGEKIDATAPVFVITTEEDGSLATMVTNCVVSEDGKSITSTDTNVFGKAVFVDFYTTKPAANVSELQIDMARFGGYYYVEASTLFRRQNDGVDMPAEITFPNVKIQSNFTFSMASTGDPSTFTFTMDAFPGYTMFDRTKKVLCVIQVVEDAEGSEVEEKSVMPHPTGFDMEEAKQDSTKEAGEDEYEDIDYTVPVPSAQGEAKWLNMATNKMIGDDIEIAVDGSVSGTIYYIDEFTAFSSTPALQSGNYFPIDLGIGEDFANKTITITKNGIVSIKDHQFKNANDTALIIRLTPETAQMDWVITIKDTGTNEQQQMKLNFRKADLLEEEFEG